MSLFETLGTAINPTPKTIKAVKVNHGNAFGNGNWFTWHCPSCSKTLQQNNSVCCGNIINII